MFESPHPITSAEKPLQGHQPEAHLIILTYQSRLERLTQTALPVGIEHQHLNQHLATSAVSNTQKTTSSAHQTGAAPTGATPPTRCDRLAVKLPPLQDLAVVRHHLRS